MNSYRFYELWGTGLRKSKEGIEVMTGNFCGALILKLDKTYKIKGFTD